MATMATEDCLEEAGDADAERLYRDQLYCKALRGYQRSARLF